MKKRFFCMVLAALMLLVLLPAAGLSIAYGETEITGFTLTTTGDFETPTAGDPITYPSDKISVASTVPAGYESIFEINCMWYDCTNRISYYESSHATGTFTPGDWYLYVFVHADAAGGNYSINTAEFEYGGSLRTITLGGKTFYASSINSSFIGYDATFTIASDGVAPMFANDSLTETAYVGDQYSKQLIATGDSDIAYSVKSGSLPTGITLSAAGMLSGVFTAAGTFNFTVEATNEFGSDTLDCTFTIETVTRITAFTLEATGNFKTPSAGDPITYPSSMIRVVSTEPAGHESALGISCAWYDCTNSTSYYESSHATGTFTTGDWYLYVFVTADTPDSGCIIDTANFESGGSLRTITLGGRTFKVGALGSLTICYDSTFNVSEHPETCTVTFNANGGSAVAPQTVEYGAAATKPADPKKNGYTFKGWYLGSTPYDFSSPVTEDITLTAKWEKIPAFDGTVTLNPNDVQMNGKTPYVIYNKQAQTPRVIVKDKSGKTLNASQYTVSYRDNVKPGTAYADVTIKSTGAKASVWFKIYLPATTSTTVQNVDNGIQVSWKKVDDAKGYVIYRRAWNLTSAGWTTFERWNNTTKTTWVDTKVYAGTRYQYGVKAYYNDPMDNYNLGIVGPLKTTVRITTRTLNSVTPGDQKLTAKWTGSSLFTGYQVQVATDKNFTKDVKTVTISNPKTYQATVTGLKAKTTYYVRVRSYHIFEGMTYYGGWSNVKTNENVQTYILNTATFKFHNPSCKDVKKMKPENKETYTGTRSEVIDMGYSPCGHCHP